MTHEQLPGYDAWLTTPPENDPGDLCPTCDGLGETCDWCELPSWAKLGLEGPCADTCQCRVNPGDDDLDQAEMLEAKAEWDDRFGKCLTCSGTGQVEPDPTERYSDYPYI